MSVDIEQKMVADGETVETVLAGTSFGAVALNVGKLRELALQVGCDPLPENKYHGGVWGRFSPGTRKKIQRAAELLMEPRRQ